MRGPSIMPWPAGERGRGNGPPDRRPPRPSWLDAGVAPRAPGCPRGPPTARPDGGRAGRRGGARGARSGGSGRVRQGPARPRHPPPRWRPRPGGGPAPARRGPPPVLLRHLLAVGPEPGEVLDLGAPDAPAVKELPAPEHRVVPAQGDEIPGEVQERPPGPAHLPVEPAPRVILAVGVVVPPLGAADLVPAAEHGDG